VRSSLFSFPFPLLKLVFAGQYNTMSIHLRIESAETRRPSFQTRPRTLLRSSEPPDSPTTRRTVCEAVETDGRPCNIALASEEEDWCGRHAQDLRDLDMAWGKVQKEAEKIDVSDARTARQKTEKLHLAITLRRRLRERFHTRGVDTVDFMKWFAKVEQDTSALADSIMRAFCHPASRFDVLDARVLNHCAGSNLDKYRSPAGSPRDSAIFPDVEYFEKIMVLQSPLSPRIPISALQGMPDNGSIMALKHFSNDLCAEGLRRLYAIVPDLDDSVRGPNSGQSGNTDAGAEIMRSWFRIMILNDSEAEVLEHASRSRTIDGFLRGRLASQLEMYCDYFENAWRPHAMQYLRVAICAQTSTEGDIKTVRLLGGVIPSTTEGLQMCKPAWDLL
jgi:hypothetical protein